MTDLTSLRLSARERERVLQRLSLYLRSGVPLLEALDLILAGTSRRSQTRILSSMRDRVASGTRLSTILRTFPRAFPQVVIGMVAAGESSGTLPEALERAAALAGSQARTFQSAVGALAYPAILLLSSLLVCGFLLMVALPRMMPLFSALRVPLPLPTRILIAFASFVDAYGYLLLGIGAACVAALVWGFRHPFSRAWLARSILRIPIIGSLIIHLSLASGFRTLASLLSSGMRLEAALGLAAESAMHPTYRALLSTLAVRALDGVPLSQAAASTPLVPRASIDLIATGERSGRLRECLTLLSRVHDEEFQARVALIGRAAEPALIGLVAGLVGFIAIAIIAPLYTLTQHIGPQ